jgi:hypothetical protein
VTSTARVVRALGSNAGDLQRLLDGADRTLAVTADHNVALAQAVQLSPPALDSTIATDRTLSVTLTDLDPLISQLRPGARELGPTTAVLRPMLARTIRVLRDAEPLLRIAPGALRSLAAASRQGVPLIAGLTPTVERLNAKLIPFLNVTDPDTRLRLYEAIGPLASALSSSASLFDANGYTYNFNVQESSGSLLEPCATGPTGTDFSECQLIQEAVRALLGRSR